MIRIIKPLVVELYVDHRMIVGIKSDNQCCYLSEDEKLVIIPNGYFVIYKESGRLVTGLSKRSLGDRNISIENMEKVL